MTIRPLSLIRAEDPDSVPAGEVDPDQCDYSAFSDERLTLERDRRQRQLEELTLHPDRSPAARSLLVSIDRELERITGELIRRARSRHPSSLPAEPGGHRPERPGAPEPRQV